MRTHAQIISDAGKHVALAQTLGLPTERVRFWERRESIPPEHWASVATAGIAALEELAEAAANRGSSAA